MVERVASSSQHGVIQVDRGRLNGHAHARPLFTARRLEVALVAALAIVAALIRWVDLWSVPIFTDEGDEIGLALRIFRDGARPLTNDDPYLGPFFNYLLAGLFWIAGPSPWLPRAMMLVFGTLTVAAAYLLAREVTLAAGGDDSRAMLGGTIAAILLAVNPSHVIVVSHVAWGACLTPFFATAGCWLLVRALRLGEGVAGMQSSTAWLLVLAGVTFGLAFETHPMVAAFFPPIILVVTWRSHSWLRTRWPYLAGAAFIVVQLPTLLFAMRDGPARWLAAVREKQTMYDGSEGADAGSFVDRLGRLLHTLVVSLGGQVNDRDTPLAPLWHPAILLAVVLAGLALVWLCRRRQPLLPLLVLSNIVLLPLVNGKYTPIISNSRYVSATVIALLVAMGVWAASSLPPGVGLGRLGPLSMGRDWRRLAPSLLVLMLGVVSAISLTMFYVDAQRDARTNDRLLASLAALEAAYQPGDVIVVDRAMLRDWTLTEGRLQRVVSGWLDLRGLPSQVVDVEESGRARQDLADRGGLAVLAQKSVGPVGRAYRLAEIAQDAAPGAPSGTGYSVVRLSKR